MRGRNGEREAKKGGGREEERAREVELAKERRESTYCDCLLGFQ